MPIKCIHSTGQRLMDFNRGLPSNCSGTLEGKLRRGS